MNSSGYGTSVGRRAMVVLDPCAADAADALEGQQRVTSNPYYSTVHVEGVRSEDEAGGPYDYAVNIPNRGLRAFGYGLGDTMEAAGFAGGQQATLAETNILTRNQTLAGQYVEIWGLALLLQNASWDNDDDHPQLDYHFAAALFRSLSVEIGLNGDENTLPLGTIPMIPGAGGMFGGAQAASGLPFLDGAQNHPFADNGYPTIGNFKPMPEGMIWRPANEPDGNLNIIFRQQHDIVIPSGGDLANRALGTDQAAIASVSAGYNYPTKLACDITAILIGQVVGGRSRLF